MPEAGHLRREGIVCPLSLIVVGRFGLAAIEVARSGDIAYIRGTYDVAMNDPKGKPMKDTGKLVEVWKKQSDGGWKCAVDTWNSDLPAAPPPSK